MQTHCELLALIDRDRNIFSIFLNLYNYFYQDDEVSKNSGSTTERGFSRLSMLFVMPVTLETILIINLSIVLS